MKVAAVQLAVVAGERDSNFSHAAKLLARAAESGIDVAVLPELWDVGFYPDEALSKADIYGNEAQNFLAEQAKKLAIHIVGGSILRCVGKSMWNTSYIFHRHGRCIASYDKSHLFSPANEHMFFQYGDHLTTFALDDIKAGCLICYDIRFPEVVRSLALQGVQVLFVPAAWPAARLHHWRTLLQARAIENQLFIVATNTGGTVKGEPSCGHSMIINPWGEILAEAGEEEQVIMETLDFELLASIRQQINVFCDRRPGLYTTDESK